jgi:hypothetical protein
MSDVVTLVPRNDKQAKEDEKFEESLRHLVVVALISAVLLITAVMISNSDTPQPDLFAIFMSVSLLIGMYTFMALMEVKLGRHLLQWKSTVILWAVFLACLGYFAKIKAVSDINSIFHTDATLFPMTLLVTTILHSASMLFWIVVIIGGVSFFSALTTHISEKDTARILMIVFCHVVNAFTCLVIAVFIDFKVGSDSSRMQMIYRIAQVADLNSFSPCRNVNAALYSSLFIDANRYLVMVVPKVDDTFNFEPRRFSVFRSVKIPNEFPVQRCVY